MKNLRPLGLVLVLVIQVSIVNSASIETTARSSSRVDDAVHRLTKELVSVNTTSVDVLDVRTPPKFKTHQKIKFKPQENIENSHAGIAIPVDEEALDDLEATTKKFNFYKYERPTTNSGLSTWILLSGQSSTSKPTTKRPVIKPILEEKSKEKPGENVTVILSAKPNRIIKPIFKKKTPSTSTSSTTSTTEAPTTTTTKIVKESTTTKIVRETTKLTKIKASELNGAFSKKSTSTTANPIKKGTKSSSTTTTTTTTREPTLGSTLERLGHTTTERNNSESTTTDSTPLPPEAKVNSDDSPDLKPPTIKRKKNKNRRKKPGKINSYLAKPIKNKNDAVSTQLYSYLAKEIMPTVGAGLVGLMVTAGLATYFLYPFGLVRRSSTDIDRRDKEGSYYYNDEFSGGMPEEEVIGKVIAGMPVSNLLSNSYKSPTYRNTYPISNSKYRFVDRRANIQPQNYDHPQKYEGGFVKGSVENVPLGPEDYQSYNNDVDRKFVVGNVPKEIDEVTPVTVPEHGPRNLKLQKISSSDPSVAPAYGPRNLRRRKRSSVVTIESSEDFTEDPGVGTEIPRKRRSGISNELDSEDSPVATDEEKTTMNAVTTLSENASTETTSQKVVMFFDNIKYLLFLKARLALEVLRNASSSFSEYISNVQNKVENNYRNFIRKYDSGS